MEYLSGIKDFPYDISVYSKQEALVKYAGRMKIDLLLVSETAYADIKQSVEAERVMVLNESGNLTWSDLQNIRK